MGSLTHRLILIFSALVIVIVGVLSWYSQSQIQQMQLDLTQRGIAFEVRQQQKVFLDSLQHFREDILFFAGSPALQGVLQARLKPQRDFAQAERESSVLANLQHTFKQFMVHHDSISQMRLLGPGPVGDEWVRLDRKDGLPVVVSAGKLQSKGHRRYYKEAIKLAAGTVYYSHLNLNREHGKLSFPPRPTLRLATPVYLQGQPSGLLIINLNVAPALEGLRNGFPWAGDLYLVNEKFDFLSHPDPAKRFAFELGKTERLDAASRQWTERLKQLKLRQGGVQRQRELQNWSGEQQLAYMNWFQIGGKNRDPARRFALVYAVDREEVLAPFMDASQYNLFLALGLLLLGVVAVFLFASGVTQPLRRLEEAIIAYGEGRRHEIKFTNRQDEVGRISSRFIAMQQSIDARSQALTAEQLRLQSVLYSAVDGIIIMTEEGRIERINPAAERLFGYAIEEIEGEQITKLMSSPHHFQQEGYLESYLTESDIHSPGRNIEVEGRDKSGAPLALSLSISCFELLGKTHFTGIVHDMRERRALEKALKKANDHLEKVAWERTEALTQEVEEHQGTQAKLYLVNEILRRTKQAIVITDCDNHIIEVNDAYEKLTGYKQEQVLGKDPSLGKSGRHDQQFYQQMWRELEKSNHWEGEIWDRRQDGNVYPKYLSIDRILNDQGKVLNYVAMFQDLTEQKATEEELERLSHYDQLTGLPNRALFRNRLEHEFLVADRHDASVGLLLINLDRFKRINDSFGFGVGDRLLEEVAARLEGLIRKTDLVARQENRAERDSDLISRLGGDEFSIVLNELREAEDAALVARRVMALLEKPYTIDGREVFLGSSVGISIYPDNAETLNGIIQCAERALRMAKEVGRNTYRFYSEEMNRNSAERLLLETALRRAVQEQGFELHYQPKLNLLTGEVEGMEALVRWPQPDGSMMPPDAFIPLAEDTGLIIPLGSWILRQACEDTARLNAGREKPLQIAVNLSAKQFLHDDVVDLVLRTLHEIELPANCLELEITESMVMGDVDRAVETMHALKALKVVLAIDDFGTGYSSLSYLKRFPVDVLKIDQSFVREMDLESEDAAIVRAICQLGETLDMAVVAEGIETEEQLAFLKQQACQLGQGYLISRPLPLQRFEKFLSDQAATGQ
uniref:Putative Diguanylate cyclase/phosphodiesterase with PAS/PAC sensor(S) n=1 Tax=Magnetococcus massalia (strain MO-1) TaxID=451514 RepID=A0A1S7LJ78_MAGMO|nr:putative Diguanylate cyclase/phosphodiesterase with PAS/PAC sensor(S) [Candidatus Magnetococcus massalia]